VNPGSIVWGSDALQLDLSGIDEVALENEMVGASEKRLETVVTDVLEGSGLRLDSEKVTEMQVQNVEMTLQ